MSQIENFILEKYVYPDLKKKKNSCAVNKHLHYIILFQFYSNITSYGKNNSMWEHQYYQISRVFSELSHKIFTPPLWSLCLSLCLMTGVSIAGEVGVHGYLDSLSDVGCWEMTIHPSVLLSCSTSDSIKYVQRIYWLKNHKSPTKTLAPDHLMCSPWSQEFICNPSGFPFLLFLLSLPNCIFTCFGPQPFSDSYLS